MFNSKYSSESFSSFISSLNRIGFPWVNGRINPLDVIKSFNEYIPEIKLSERYRLKSYFPKKKYYLPPLFRGKPVVVGSSALESSNIDILSDVWAENIRIKAKKGYSVLTPEESMKLATTKLKVFETLKKEHPDGNWTADQVRSTFAFISQEARVFRLTWIKGILTVIFKDLNVLKGKRWLDLSSGWSDRLIAAGLLNMEYLGFDPNLDLMAPHDKVIKFLTSVNPDLKGKLKIEYIPFEESEKILDSVEPFDIVFTSPPFFTIELYSDAETQSVNKFPAFKDWITKFLFRSIKIAWNHLKDNGYLILYVGDLRDIQIAEPMNLFIETLPQASYEGIIGVENDIGTIRPCWVWKKMPSGKKMVRWNYQLKRSLKSDYPELF